jgi:ribosomal protein S18 acetylase RimI-like enzyme
MDDWRLRNATTAQRDERFLGEMLVEAIAWQPGSPSLTVEDALANPHFALYVEGWGQTGDAGVIAEDDGQLLGACWYRLFTEAKQGYGFIHPAVPELTLGVRREARGHGIGTALLDALASHARTEGHSALSLSVAEDNRAMHLYDRAGFDPVARDDGNSWTMRLDL